MLVSGEASVNKLARVASIATPENQELLGQQVKLLPKSALEIFVRDEKCAKVSKQDGLYIEKSRAQPVPGRSSDLATELREASCPQLHFSQNVNAKLLALQNKGIDINALILELLERHELEIAQEKEEIASQIQQTKSRYIPVRVRIVLTKEHGTKCSAPNCTRNSEHLHHTQRFALSRQHNPHFLAPLCKEHHKIAHSIDVKWAAKVMKNR